MARYTPDFLADLKHDYEKTDEPMRALSRKFKIGISTLSSLVEKQGWQKRSQRTRNRLPSEHLLAHAQDLVASLPARDAAIPYRARRLREPLLETEEEEEPLSPVDRIEALVVNEIAAEEAVQADLNAQPRLRAEAERCARTLSGLTQTLQKLQNIREAQAKEAPRCRYCEDNDDIPADLDAFRAALARRIDAFMRSREGEDFGDGGGKGGAAGAAAAIACDTPDAKSD